MKRLFIAAVLALAGVGAVAVYYWQQATQLPAWYTAAQSESPGAADQATAITPTAEAEGNRSGDRAATDRQASTRSKASGNQENADAKATRTNAPPLTKQQIRQNELTQLFTTEMTRKVESRKLGSALKGAKTTMQNGTVESGAVVNLSGVSPDQLPPDERAFFAKLVSAFPELSHQNFYIGVEGRPTVKDGQAQLNENLRVKLGNLSFTPAQLSQRLGIPENQIRQQLQLHVQVDNLKGKQLQMADDRPTDPNGSN